MERPRTKRQRIAEEMATKDLAWLEMSRHVPYSLEKRAPKDWFTIRHDFDCTEPKVKLTLYLDKSVVTVFKAMGKGYQARINRILSAYLHMEVAGFYDGWERLKKRRREFDEEYDALQWLEDQEREEAEAAKKKAARRR